MTGLGGDGSRRLRPLGLARLSQPKDGLLDDGKVGRPRALPFGFGVGPRYAFACRWIFDEALPVPDDLADIEPVL